MTACGEHGIALAGRARESAAVESYDAAARSRTPLAPPPPSCGQPGPRPEARTCSPTPGTGDPVHLEQNLAAASLRLTDDGLTTLPMLA